MAGGPIGGPPVRWFVAVLVFLCFAGLGVVFAVSYLDAHDVQAGAALFAGWSALVAAVVYITHPSRGDSGG